MTCLEGECAYRPADPVRRFNVGRVIVVNEPRAWRALMYRRKLNLEATVESGSSYFSFKRLVSGAYNAVLIGSTCTILP